LVLANRLSVNNTVAVIEAGGFYEFNNANITEIPSNDIQYLGKQPYNNNPLHDWVQYTTPQAGLNGTSVLFSQGRTLGGGSARNFMWFQRAPKGTFQKWADAVGDASFTWDAVLPYFKKSVAFTPPFADSFPSNVTPLYDASDFSPTGGPLQVCHSGSYSGTPPS